MTTRRRLRIRGFWLIELLILLGMLGLIALAGGRLFDTAVRLGHASAQAANSSASLDAMLTVLRQDAWSAGTITPSDHGAAVTLVDGDTKVTWTIRQETMTRDAGGRTRTWPISAGSAFAVEGPTLVLRLADTKTFRGGEVHLSSEVMLLARRPS